MTGLSDCRRSTRSTQSDTIHGRYECSTWSGDTRGSRW